MSGYCPARRSGFMSAAMAYGGGGASPPSGPYVAFQAASEIGPEGGNAVDVTLPSTTMAGDWLVGFSRTAIDGNALTECRITTLGGPPNAEWLEVARVRDENPVVNSQQVVMIAPVPAGQQSFRAQWFNAGSSDPVFIDYQWLSIYCVRAAAEFVGAAGQSIVAAVSGVDVLASGVIADVGAASVLIVSACTNETEFNAPPEPLLGSGQSLVASWGSYGLGFGDFSLGAEQVSSGMLQARYTAQVADEYFVMAAAFA